MRTIAFVLGLTLVGCIEVPQTNILQSERSTETRRTQLNSVRNGIAKAISIVNDYKHTTANFLADNDSVSSVPRNVASLQARHVAWVKEFVSKVESNAPAWSTVTTKVTYKAAAENIRTFEAGIPSDDNLLTAEERLARDLVILDAGLGGMIDRMQGVMTRELGPSIIEAAGNEGRGLVEQMRAGILRLAEYRQTIAVARRNIREAASKRRFLRREVPRAWKALLELRLSRVNAGEAQAIITEIDAAMHGEAVYADVMSEAMSVAPRVREHLDTFTSPLHARRNLHIGLSVLERLSAKVNRESITESTRTQLLAGLADHKAALEGLQGAVKSAMTRSADLAKERRRVAKLYVTRYGDTMTEECRGLGSAIGAAEPPAEGIEPEGAYASFKKSCMR